MYIISFFKFAETLQDVVKIKISLNERRKCDLCCLYLHHRGNAKAISEKKKSGQQAKSLLHLHTRALAHAEIVILEWNGILSIVLLVLFTLCFVPLTRSAVPRDLT